MGIDPVTHKPLNDGSPPPREQAEPPKNHQEPPPHSNSTTNSSHEMDQNSITTDDQDIALSPFIDSNNNINIMDDEEVNNGFCIDEVPLIQPHEILVPPETTTSSASSSLISPTTSSSSSSSSCSNYSYDSRNLVNNEELMPTTFDWQNDFMMTTNINMGNIWEDIDDDFITNLDYLINNDGNLDFHHRNNIVDVEDSWKF